MTITNPDEIAPAVKALGADDVLIIEQPALTALIIALGVHVRSPLGIAAYCRIRDANRKEKHGH